MTVYHRAGLSCTDLASLSSCPGLGQELEQLERERRLQQCGGREPAARPRGFLKPRDRSRKVVGERAPSLEPCLARRSPSPLQGGTSAGPRSLSATARRLRASSSSSSSSAAAGSSKVGLSKRPSVDSGINLEVAAARPRLRGGRQLSK